MEEINMYKDDYPSLSLDLMDQMLYQGHALSREIIGTKKTVGSMTRSMLLEFKQQYYTTDKAVISIAGKYSQTKVLAMCEKYFKLHASHKPTRVGRLFKDTQDSPRVRFKTKATEQVSLALAVPALAEGDKRMPVLKMLSIIMGGSMSSRLAVELREKRGLCYAVGSIIWTTDEAGDFMVRAGLDRKRIVEAIEVILIQLRKMKKSLVSSSELKRAMDLVRGSLVLALEQSDFLASYYAKEVLQQEKLTTPEQKLKELAKVRASDIRRLARDLFRTEKLNLAIVSPMKKSRVGEFRKLLRV